MYYMAYPDGYLWEFPGMYSMTVSYGSKNSFYFCPYIGLCVINFCEFKDHKHTILAVTTMLTTFSLSLLLIFTRGHYSIDLFGGFLFGHYFWIMSGRMCYLIDSYLMKIPFHHRFPHFPKKCLVCKHSINEWADVKESEEVEGEEVNGGVEIDGKIMLCEDKGKSFEYREVRNISSGGHKYQNS